MKKGTTYVGMDAHKVAIKLAVLVAGETKPVLGGHPKPATDGRLKTGHHG
jgi:hypothetical protein